MWTSPVVSYRRIEAGPTGWNGGNNMPRCLLDRTIDDGHEIQIEPSAHDAKDGDRDAS
jgi:hypothetical protein